jgi:hypothetical protein
MEIEANRKSAGPSPFSRPPQPKTASPFGSSIAAPRASSHPGGMDLSRAQTTPARAAGPTTTGEERKTLEGQRRGGGQWFYWVAGLSLINSFAALAGQQWRFILGLGVTQFVQELAQQPGGAGTKAGLVSLAVIGLFAFLGQRAVQGYQWAFLLGLTLYALDGVIFLLIQDWAGVGFHAFALMMIMRGYLAARRLPSPSA